ncbi:MAG: phage shock protein B [Desulfobacterales bacterium]|nr:phage shock protein B [Desulfobacterales bacterium]
MHGVHFLTVFMGGALLLLIALGVIIIGIIRTAKSGGSPKVSAKTRSEETQMIQEIYNGLNRMEKRVEALETILMDRSGANQGGTAHDSTTNQREY